MRNRAPTLNSCRIQGRSVTRMRLGGLVPISRRQPARCLLGGGVIKRTLKLMKILTAGAQTEGLCSAFPAMEEFCNLRP